MAVQPNLLPTNAENILAENQFLQPNLLPTNAENILAENILVL